MLIALLDLYRMPRSPQADLQILTSSSMIYIYPHNLVYKKNSMHPFPAEGYIFTLSTSRWRIALDTGEKNHLALSSKGPPTWAGVFCLL